MSTTAQAIVVRATLVVAALSMEVRGSYPAPGVSAQPPFAPGVTATGHFFPAVAAEPHAPLTEPGLEPLWWLLPSGFEPAPALPLLVHEPLATPPPGPAPDLLDRVAVARLDPVVSPPPALVVHHPMFRIPEPKSIILVVTGMIGLVARRHLRRQIMAAD